MIAALFVQTGGVYFGLPDVDPWDEARDARAYTGPWPVVAHPPCSRWCQLAHVIKARYGYEPGEDGGCFASALSSVREFGGVLEHPARTLAWKSYGLGVPARGARRPAGDGLGWVCEVSQAAYGHRARKLTWLYARSDEKPADLDWSRPAPTATVSFLTNHGGGHLPRLSKKEASRTPPAFRDTLISIARNAVLGKRAS